MPFVKMGKTRWPDVLAKSEAGILYSLENTQQMLAPNSFDKSTLVTAGIAAAHAGLRIWSVSNVRARLWKVGWRRFARGGKDIS
jgi:hypothetical protein